LGYRRSCGGYIAIALKLHEEINSELKSLENRHYPCLKNLKNGVICIESFEKLMLL
jgi:hypothetical protein